MSMKILALFISALVTSVAAKGESKEWKCIFSPADNAFLWVTKTGPTNYACAGPTHNTCYWFEGDNCTKLITSTHLVGKLCCCHSAWKEKGWCNVAAGSFASSTKTHNTQMISSTWITSPTGTEVAGTGTEIGTETGTFAVVATSGP